jgi:hypothetical protein
LEEYGLDANQIKALAALSQQEIGAQICKELGIRLPDLREAIYGSPEPTGGTGAAAYDQGKTHIRRVVPTIIPANTDSEIMLMGQGFKSDKNLVTVEFRTGWEPETKVPGAVTDIVCGVDVWQRVSVKVNLGIADDWSVHAHNDDDQNASGEWIWSAPHGRIHVV